MTPSRTALSVSDEQRPTLGLLLPVISPWSRERSLWASAVYRQAATEIEAIYLFLRASEYYLFLFRCMCDVTEEAGGLLRRQATRNLLLVALHLVLKVASYNTYLQCRWVLLTHSRLYRLLSYVAQLKHVRNGFATGLHVGLVDGILLYQVVQGSPAFVATRAAILMSMSAVTCLHSLPSLVPFLLAAPVQLVYAFFTFRYFSTIPADVLADPRYAVGTQALCDTLSSSLPALHTLLPARPGTPAPPAVCGLQRTWVLVLFLQLYVGFTFPLYVCYATERHFKARFLRESFRSIPGSPDAGTSTFGAAPAAPAHWLYQLLRSCLSHIAV